MTTIGQLQSEYQKLHIRLEYITQLLYCQYCRPSQLCYFLFWVPIKGSVGSDFAIAWIALVGFVLLDFVGYQWRNQDGNCSENFT